MDMLVDGSRVVLLEKSSLNILGGGCVFKGLYGVYGLIIILVSISPPSV